MPEVILHKARESNGWKNTGTFVILVVATFCTANWTTRCYRLQVPDFIEDKLAQERHCLDCEKRLCNGACYWRLLRPLRLPRALDQATLQRRANVSPDQLPGTYMQCPHPVYRRRRRSEKSHLRASRASPQSVWVRSGVASHQSFPWFRPPPLELLTKGAP